MATYKEYLTNAASQSVTFAGDVMETAVECVRNIPEVAGQVSAMTGSYLETAFEYVGEIPETSGQVAKIAEEYVSKLPAVSYDVQQRIQRAASVFASKTGDALANLPAYAESLANAAAAYSTDAINLANAYLSNALQSNPLGWLHVDTDGNADISYAPGLGGESGGAGASGEWETAPEAFKYPQRVPTVAPQIVPIAGKAPTRRRISEVSSPTPGDCVNKMTPQLGMVFDIDYFVDWLGFPATIHIYWWDNLYARRDFGTGKFQSDEQTQWLYFKGTPALPKTRIESMLPAARNGGFWRCSNLVQNQVYQVPSIPHWYLSREWWDHTTFFYSQGRCFEEQHHSGSPGWYECHSIELGYNTDHIRLAGGQGDASNGYYTVGFGAGDAFTYSMATFTHAGLTPPDDWPTPPHHAAYLATVGALDALQSHNLFNVLGGGLWR